MSTSIVSAATTGINTSASAGIALLTGFTGIIGGSIAKNLLNAGYTVIAPVRDEHKAAQVVKSLFSTSPPHLHLHQLDLNSHQSIIQFCSTVKQHYPKLHVLINNAAIVPATKTYSTDGLEQQYAINIYSYYLLMKHLQPLLSSTSQSESKGGIQRKSRIVNVASNYAGEFEVDDLQFTHRRYDLDTGYRQSKAANRLMSYYAAELWRSEGITVNAVHPGFVHGQLTKSLGFHGTESAEKGADTPTFAAINPQLEGVTGEWIVSRRITNCPFKTQKQEQQKLWKVLEQTERQLNAKQTTNSQ